MELELKNISKFFEINEKKEILFFNLNQTFSNKKSYCIVGKSGSGKSTLLSIIAGFEKPSNGYVIFDKKNISLIFQTPHFIKELSVLENIAICDQLNNSNFKNSIEKSKKLLESIWLQDFQNSKIEHLSGGQQQRISILRALIQNPKFILADEITSSLDDQNSKYIIDFLLKYCKENEIGLILSSHDQIVIKSVDIVFNLNNDNLEKIFKN